MALRSQEVILTTGEVMWLIDGILHPKPSAPSRPIPQVDKSTENEAPTRDIRCPVCGGTGTIFNERLHWDAPCAWCNGKRWVTTVGENASLGNDADWMDAMNRLDHRKWLRAMQLSPGFDGDPDNGADADDNWGVRDDGGDRSENMLIDFGLDEVDLDPWVDDDPDLKRWPSNE